MVEESEEAVEDLLPQLLQNTETDFLSDIGSATGSDSKKRKNQTGTEREKGKKRKIVTASGIQKSEAPTGSTVEISLVAMNGMVEALQNGTRQMGRIEKVVKKTEKALTEITCMMGKVVDVLTQFKNVVEHSAKEDRKREERLFDIERKREEERTREREAERRREDRRREAEKREREELKKLVKEALTVEKKSNADDKHENTEREAKRKKEKSKADDEKENIEREVKRKEEKRDTDDKENKKQPIKLVLEKSYTENSMRDFSKKKST